MKIFIVDLGLKTRIDKLMFLMPAVTNLRFWYRKRCQGKFHAIALILMAFSLTRGDNFVISIRFYGVFCAHGLVL